MFATVHENIVPHEVFASVMLVKAAGLGVVNEVILEPDASAAFVRVKPPAAIGVGVDVVKDIVTNRRAFRRAERVDAAHVAQQSLAEMMNVIEPDVVSLAVAFAVAPAPTDADAGVK